MIQIRPNTPADAELIADLSRETFYDAFAAQNTEADMNKFLQEQFSREELMAEVGETGNYFLLAYDNDALAGYIKLKEGTVPLLQNDNAIEISRIYVRTGLIGKGVGKALLEASFEHARHRQKEWIWLGVWEHNHRAIQFYTRFGFEKFSEHDFLLGDDLQRDWLMKKKLA